MPKLLTGQQFVAVIRKRVEAAGGAPAFAEKLGITRQHLYQILRTGHVSAAMAERLGYTVERRYREVG